MNAATNAVEMVLPGIGEPETVQRRLRALDPLEPGQALVRMEATGVSFAERAMRRGVYYDQPAFPFVPGYDLVGVVEALGEDAHSSIPGGLRVGQRVAALTKVGGWAQRVVLDAADLVPVPDRVTAEDAETVIVNGLTAWRVLHRVAKIRAGQTIVVFAAAGGVGSVLVQLALAAGVRVIGTAGAGQQERLRTMGAVPIDYRAEDVPARIRELAPGGVDAVIDNVGGPGIVDSWRMLAPGGTLVTLSDITVMNAAHPMVPFLLLYGRLQLWNLLPNRRRAHFFNIWAGHRRIDRFRDEVRADLSTLFALLADGSLTAPIDSRYPLSQVAAAMRHAEAGGIAGKVIIVPDPEGLAGGGA
jgi:NADPH:quinone reductase-like Zn-dependent oxidoreductase